MQSILCSRTALRATGVVLAATLFLSLAAVGPAFAGAQQARGSAPELFSGLELQSKLMGRPMPYDVLVPRGYEDHPLLRYPVLYLLHGLGGRYDDWITKTSLAAYAARYPLIVVMPDDGNGWYTDSPVAPDDKYGAYIVQELIPAVDAQFRTIASRRGRAVAGLSMGGYGALRYALDDPNMFTFAASLSGAFDLPEESDEALAAMGWPLIRESIDRAFGRAGSAARRAGDVYGLAARLTAQQVANLPYLYLAIGVDDALLSANQRMDRVLLRIHAPHEYVEAPGAHNWRFWDRQVQAVLRIAADRMPLTQYPD